MGSTIICKSFQYCIFGVCMETEINVAIPIQKLPFANYA